MTRGQSQARTKDYRSLVNLPAVGLAVSLRNEVHD
jgi:hypothetical protein